MISRIGAASFLALLISTQAEAQMGAASESFVAVLRSLTTASGSSVSANYSAQVEVGLVAEFTQASSINYRLESGPAAIVGALDHNGPLVFGIGLAQGHASGGELRRLFGFNLDDAPQTAALGALTAALLVPVSASALDLQTPAGINPFGNPLGPIGAEVLTPMGSSLRPEAFSYLPALTKTGVATLGCELELTMTGAPLSFYILALGGTIPDVGVPFPPYAGALEILSPWIVFGGLRVNISGQKKDTFKLPDDPSLAFVNIAFQSLEITSTAPLAGSFTNVVSVTLLP